MTRDDLERDAQVDVHEAAKNAQETVTASCDNCGRDIECTEAEAKIADPLLCDHCV